MKSIFCFGFVFFSSLIFAQTSYKISYEKYSNGTLIENQDPVFVFTNEKVTQVIAKSVLENSALFPSEYFLVNRNNLHIIQEARLDANRSIQTIDSASLNKQTFEFLPETKKILGYTCKKAKTIINSNTLEIWYTQDLKVAGSPSTLGQKLGLVLEINRNGNNITLAHKIEKIKTIPLMNAAYEKSKGIDMLTYRDLVWKSRFTTLPVFKEEVICFSSESKSNDSILKYANGTIILRKIKFPIVQKGSQIFVDAVEQSNGDAYDRTGSIFLIPQDKSLSFLNGLQDGIKTLPVYDNGNSKQYQGIVKTENYTPLLELMRFFTPFGIHHYNYIELKDKNWEDKVHYRQDISELAASLSGQEVYVGAFIGNYDKGGHKLSVNITLHKEEEAVEKSNFNIPLFNTTNVMEMAGQEYGTLFNSDKGLYVSFTLEKEVENAQLRYITTGHGGWENGDEFVPKKNTLLLDEKEVFHFTPWREDCGAFRLYNPASGNFQNGLSSSDYSRSNWCPGTATNPIYIELGNLKAGKHTLQVVIPQGKPEGTSFSSWNVSGVLIGNVK